MKTQVFLAFLKERLGARVGDNIHIGVRQPEGEDVVEVQITTMMYLHKTITGELIDKMDVNTVLGYGDLALEEFVAALRAEANEIDATKIDKPHDHTAWMPPDPTTRNGLPHSRACGWMLHDHGLRCSSDCPTCHGSGLKAYIDKIQDKTRPEYDPTR